MTIDVKDGARPETELSTEAYGCTTAGCNEVATVTVRRSGHGEQPLCPLHWQTFHQAAPEGSVAMRLLDRPECFVPACRAGAVSVGTYLNGSALPVCEQHLYGLRGATLDGLVAAISHDS